jgi:hypothetical protein
VADSDKQSIRIPKPRWQGASGRAKQVHRSSGAGIVNAFLVKYHRGDLDSEVSAWLEELTGVPHPPQPGR